MKELVLNENTLANTVIRIAEETTILVDGESTCMAIYIETNETVHIRGGRLTVHNSELYQPAIGTETFSRMSYGRWGINNQNSVNLDIELEYLCTKSAHEDFSIGTYGLVTDWQNLDLSRVNDFDIAGYGMVGVRIPGRSDGSTKISGPAVYMKEDEYTSFMLQKSEEEAAKEAEANSNFPASITLINSLEGYFFERKYEDTLKYLIGKCEDLDGIGKIIGNLAVFVDKFLPTLYDKKLLSDESYTQRLFTLIRDKEVELMEERGVFFKYPIALRALICWEDASFCQLERKHFHHKSERGNFLQELNLSKEMHNLYFPEHDELEYKSCERFIYGMNMWRTITNETVKGPDEVYFATMSNVSRERPDEDLKKSTVF